MIRIPGLMAAFCATVVIFSGATDAQAQRGRPDPSEMFQRMDRNSDGELSKEEQEQLPSFIRDRINDADTDGNGSLTKEEIQASIRRHGGPPKAGRDQERSRPEGPPSRIDNRSRGKEGRGKESHRAGRPGRGDRPPHHGLRAGTPPREDRHRGPGRDEFKAAPPKPGGRPSFSHRGPGGPPWMQRGHHGRPAFTQQPAFAFRGPRRGPSGPPWASGPKSLGPPWLKHGRPHHADHHRPPQRKSDAERGNRREAHGRPEGHGRPGRGRADQNEAGSRHRGPGEGRRDQDSPPAGEGRPGRDRRPGRSSGGDEDERREASVTAETA